ncbi:cytochrome b561 and DOMON domain-containing protein At2g04850 [Aristolochia californica]|uniref:cytochrome b561 and DOMON domain-containing protein At2g04850 n=1 Tax=Aristolochia californica TaxID=171875 RepID=UPI0035DE6AC8
MGVVFFFLFFILVASPTVHAGRCATTIGAKTFKKCMTLPTQAASIAWTFHPRNATLEIAFSGSFISPTGWVGWGINPISAEMTGTRALIAFSDPNSGHLVVLPYILDPTVKLQRTPLLSRPLDVHLLSSSASLYGVKAAVVHEGAPVQIYGTFKLEPNRTRIHLVWNRGLYVQGYSPTIHPTTTADLGSITTVDITSGVVTSGHTKISTLKSTHAVLNSVSWGFFLPVGAVTARYLRQIQSIGPTWFYVHAAIQLTGFVLGTIGFAIGMRLGSISPAVTYGLHRKLGIATFSLGALQTLALMFRPKTTHKFRKYWKSYHHFVGYACVVVGVVNVFQGFEVMGFGLSYAKLGYCLALATLIGICIALEVNSWVLFCRKAKEEKLRREGMVGRFEKGSGSH